MIVVSDTSPITTLLKIGRVDLLRLLYGEVLIPMAVREELSRHHLVLPDFFQCRSVVARDSVKTLLLELDLGEAEAIVLAKENKADLLLIDESDGRLVAARQGLRFIGLIGVLIESKQKGLIPEVLEILNEIERKTPFFISAEIRNRALQRSGEL